MAIGALGLDAELWDLLACPCDEHGAVTAVEPTPALPEGGIRCTVCGCTFPVRSGIPVMLIDEAIAPER